MDSDDIAVEAAEVLLSDQDKWRQRRHTTSVDGSFYVALTHEPGRAKLQLTVTKSGFATHEQLLAPGMRHDNVKIVLKRKPD